MYLPTVLTKNARLTPLSDEARKPGFLEKAKSIMRSKSRQMTKDQGEMFLSRLQEQTPIIHVQTFQGFTGGHILQQKR
jgi:hypothetical protein